MNVNEVISNRAIQLLGGKLGSKKPVHPNDDVNMAQSSNDTFPTAMHIAAVIELDRHLLPSLEKLTRAIRGEGRRLEGRRQDWPDASRGRGSAHGRRRVVGLGGSAPRRDRQRAAEHGGALSPCRRRDGRRHGAQRPAAGSPSRSPAKIAELTRRPFETAPNKFAAQGSLDAMVAAMAALRGVAVTLMKIANDMRWLASGPRCGLAELVLPANEPGSSIMPGKVNPTQCEAIVMICHPGHRRGQRRRRRGQPGQLRAQRDAPDHHQQLPPLRAHPGRRLREVPHLLGRGDGARSRRGSPSSSIAR